MKEEFVNAMADMEEEKALALVGQMLDSGMDPYEILDASREAMTIIGNRFEQQEYFLPELIIAGDMLKAVGEMVKPKLSALTGGSRAKSGKVVLGTVAGDIHDIGKDVVSFMLDVNNFEVFDLGIDVPAATFVDAVKKHKPDIVGLSGFLTLAFDQMRITIDALKEAGVRDGVKVMIGGAIMDESAAQYVGADAYGRDASTAVKLAKSWMGGN